MPNVSVIVPNYNHARFLRRRIDSILAQTYQDFELILLDDCSTDESRAILEEYARDPRVRLEFNPVNSGSPFKQWNKGVRLANGKYVWMAESDDYADPTLLERLLALLRDDPKLAFAYCRSWCVSADDCREGFIDEFYFPELDRARWQADFRSDGREECRRYMVHVNTVSNASAVVFRKDAYERAGGADEGMRICGDWKLWSSLMFQGDVAYVADPLNYYRNHEASVRNTLDENTILVPECLHVISWIVEQLTPPADVLEKSCAKQANRWVPLLMSLRVPLGVKLTVIRYVRTIDPHPLRRVGGPVSSAVQRKILRHWRELRAMMKPART